MPWAPGGKWIDDSTAPVAVEPKPVPVKAVALDQPEFFRSCPSCRSNAASVSSRRGLGSWFWVVCGICATSGPVRDTREAALQAWNEA